jgi:hypothetical protein
MAREKVALFFRFFPISTSLTISNTLRIEPNVRTNR